MTNKVWFWVFGIGVGLIIIAWIFFGRSDRQAYYIARGAIEGSVQASQDRIDTAVEMATASVDLALTAAGNLPSQQAKADLIKQDIEEIGNRLKGVSETRGVAAITQLDESIDQYNQTLQAVEDASQQATDPVVKSTLDRIYGILQATKEQLVQTILNTTSK
jgi:hypothetical protein